MSDRLTKAKRVVIKIGSALLVESDSGRLDRDWLETLADDVSSLAARGQQILIVSSGAIALGRSRLGLSGEPAGLAEKQAAAAAGQIRLAQAYQEALEARNLVTAQVLLTLDDTEQRRRYLNARDTLNTLLSLGAIPVINENDTVATDEIRYGDNDRLAARVAQMADADCLVLLSDVDGLFESDPASNPDARLIPEVEAVTPDIEAIAGAAPTAFGTGGMKSKVAAAKIALAAGCHVVITSGRCPNPLAALQEGARCTWFVPAENPQSARKQWIAGGLKPAGSVTVDAGATAALGQGKSLLPAGITAVDGDFGRGDGIRILGPDGAEIGRGLISYSADDARAIMGHKSDEIGDILGYRGRDEMIQRDDLVLL